MWFWRVCSWLYRSRFLQVNTYFAAFFEMYKRCALLHFCFCTSPDWFWQRFCELRIRNCTNYQFAKLKIVSSKQIQNENVLSTSAKVEKYLPSFSHISVLFWPDFGTHLLFNSSTYCNLLTFHSISWVIFIFYYIFTFSILSYMLYAVIFLYSDISIFSNSSLASPKKLKQTASASG